MKFLFGACITFVFAFGIASTAAQNSSIDSLQNAAAHYEKRAMNRPMALRDSVLVNLYHKLAVAHGSHDLKQAMAYSGKQLSVSGKIGYKKGMAEAYNNIGTIYDSQANSFQAIKYYKLSLAVSQQIGAKFSESAAYGNIGSVYGRQSNHAEAIRYMLKALKIARQTGDKYSIAGLYNNIGVLYMAQNNHAEALRNYELCFKMMAELGNKGAIGVISNNIGQIYAQQGKSEQAIASLQKGLAFSKQASDLQSMANNYSGLGHVYIDKKQYDRALEYYFESLSLSKQLGDARGTTRGYAMIARTYFLMGDLKTAQRYTQLAHDAVQKDDLEQLQNIFEVESKIFEAQKDFRRAFESQVRFKELSDSVYNAETMQSFNQLKLKFDLKSAQDSIAAIQLKKDLLARAERKSQDKTRDFTYIVLGMVMLFLVILIWQRNKIAVVRREKALEQQRNRISRDLHDNLGAQLSTVRMFMSTLQHKPDVADTVNDSIEMLDASIGELRGIMHEMHNPVLAEKGFLVATEELINKVNQLHDVSFALTHHKMDVRPSVEIEHQLFRVIQELVNNTLKYASARQVTIDVLRRDKMLVMMYEDDGKGFDPAIVKKGYGLRNIEFRIGSIGGTVDFDSTPGAGARTIIEIPENG